MICNSLKQKLLTFLLLQAIFTIYLIELRSLPFVSADYNLCVGSVHTCFINKSKRLYCWGNGLNFQIGTKAISIYGDSSEDMANLLPIANDVDQVSCGSLFTCFVSSNKVYCFGYNMEGELGRGTETSSEYYSTTDTPVALPTATNVKISSFDRLTCAIVNTSIYCWGISNTLSYGSTPQKIAAMAERSPISISVGSDHICFLDADTSVYCWGNNGDGQLGIASTSMAETTPNKVNITSPLSSVSAGYDHTCVRFLANDKIACFGANTFYQLGDGLSNSKGQMINDMKNLESLSKLGNGYVFAGKQVTCVVSPSNSGVYCIGNNNYYTVCAVPTALSLGSSLNDYPPNNKMNISLASFDNITVAIGVGNHHCVTDGTSLYCWGLNSYGQLGINSKLSLTSCNSARALQNICIGTECQQITCSPCIGNIYPYIQAGIAVGVILLITFGAAMVGLKKRSQFDRQIYTLPDGTQLTGAQIWRSHTIPLPPPRIQPQNQPTVSVYAVEPIVPPSPAVVAPSESTPS